MSERDDQVQRIISALVTRDLSIATCESLTGGLVGAAFTAVPGSSKVYRGGLITYATDLKVDLAGVDADFVASYGVVNEQTALEMARGALIRCGADVAVSCTGVAGPHAQDGIEPGTVWIALVQAMVGDETADFSRELHLVGDRTTVRQQVVDQVIDLVFDVLSPVG